MVKNYSLKDAFKALDEINDELIETSIVINGPLTESLEEKTEKTPSNANIRVFNIEWDTDGELVDLPKELYLELAEENLREDEGMLEEIIANELSDQTGWLVNYFDYERIEPETVIESKENLTEETFSLSDDKGLKDIEEFQKEDEKEEPELTVVDTNADEIDEVASNQDAAGSFVFTCDKCGENIFRTLDELKEVGYERIDDTLFKLKNKDINMGEFYHCTKCGNDTFTGNKQIVLADIDAEVEGKPTEEENSVEDIEPVSDNSDTMPAVDVTEEDVVVEESLEKKELTEAAEITDDDIVEDYLSDRVAKVLDDAGILYGDIVEYPEHKKVNIVGVDESEWEEAQEAIKSELDLRVIIPSEDHEEFDDEIEVFEESLIEALSADKLAQFKEHGFFKDFNENAIRKFISLYLDFIGDKKADVTPEEVYEFMSDEGLGVFALDNIEALRFLTFKQIAEKDPKLIEACRKYAPLLADEEAGELLELIFKDGIKAEELRGIADDVKEIYLKLIESKDDNNDDNSTTLKEGFKKIVKGQTFWSIDGEEWEECTQEEFDECGYEDVTEPEDEFDEISITEIEEESLDKAISEKLSEMYENFGSYKTETAFLKDVENKIILEGNLTFNTSKEQHVRFILEAVESDNNNIKFKLTCEDFADFESELKTKLNEGLLEADEEYIVVDTPKAEIIEITDAESLKDLYKKWAMTWEGLSPESFDEAVDIAGGENAKGYLISGKLMNEICHLTGDNAYPDDLNIFAVYPFKGIAMRFGARWMADIVDNNARREGFHPFEELTEASSAEKRAFRHGGKHYGDLIQGKAIARIKNKDARNAAIAAIKAGRPEVAKQFYGDRKENQAINSFEKKENSMQKAGMTDDDLVNEEYEDKDPKDYSRLEDYDDFGLSDLEYTISHDNILDAENITEEDERDWSGDADGYVSEICSVAAWGGVTSNEDEKRLLVDYIARNYPGKLKVIRKYLGNDQSSVKLDADVTLECKEEK